MKMDLSRAAWRKSSHSGSQNCVEVAGSPPEAVAVRDSGDPAGPALVFAPGVWKALTRQVKTGELGLASRPRSISAKSP